MAKIDWLKRMGLTLDEIAEIIPLYFGEQTSMRGRRKMIAMLERRLAQTEERVEGLVAHRDELREAIERLTAALAEPARR
jgi:DNA-binding transcriptional MerR regulator